MKKSVPAARKLFGITAFILLAVSGTVHGEARAPKWSLYVELDRMFAVKIGTEYRFTDHLGVKASAGVSTIGFPLISYNLLGVYHILDFENHLQLDVEFGLPLAYVDPVFAGGPLPGWVPGVSIALGYQNPQVFRVGLRAGFGYHFEIMGGVWQEPRPLMDVGIESAWYIW